MGKAAAMRVITGSAKGLRLKAPRGWSTRPTGDRVKEALFSILGSHVVEARVLDLFAGTGNLGIEALSRGAATALFVDTSAECSKIIRENLMHTRLVEGGEVWRRDCIGALRQLIAAEQMFELIFCDPPYNKGFVAQVLELVDTSAVLRAQGVLVFEHSAHEPLVATKSLQCFRQQTYGETRVSFLRRVPMQEG